MRAQDEKGRTALSRCASGDHQCVKMLLNANADVDLADKEGISPLHYASLSSSFDNVNLMLQYEALVNTFDKTNGSSPLHDACFSGSLKYESSSSSYYYSSYYCYYFTHGLVSFPL